MSFKQSLLGLTLLSFTCAPVHAAGPSQARRDQLANKATTALLLAGLGAKCYEFASRDDISTDHLPRKLTSLLTLLLAGGKIGERIRPGANKAILHGVLGSLLLAGMLPNASKFAKMPGMSYFAKPSIGAAYYQKNKNKMNPTPHHLRILGLILFYELGKHGIVWAADKLGLTTVPAPVKNKKTKK